VTGLQILPSVMLKDNKNQINVWVQSLIAFLSLVKMRAGTRGGIVFAPNIAANHSN